MEEIIYRSKKNVFFLVILNYLVSLVLLISTIYKLLYSNSDYFVSVAFMIISFITLVSNTKNANDYPLFWITNRRIYFEKHISIVKYFKLMHNNDIEEFITNYPYSKVKEVRIIRKYFPSYYQINIYFYDRDNHIYYEFIKPEDIDIVLEPFRKYNINIIEKECNE